MRLPSPLNVGIYNLQRLLKNRVKPGMEVLEIGCAPGKILAWVNKRLNCAVAGLDYSEKGIKLTNGLFEALGIEGDIRCENIFHHSFPPGQFDFVYSAGLIEHFADPAAVVRQHVLLAKPGGMAMIVIPHYGGVYGKLQRYFDNANLSIHNLEIMNRDSLVDLAPEDLTAEVKSYSFGRISPWIIGFDKKLIKMSIIINYAINALGLLQPVDFEYLCPLLVLEIVRKS